MMVSQVELLQMAAGNQARPPIEKKKKNFAEEKEKIPSVLCRFAGSPDQR